jgi:3-oxoacyl-[acyl-carrier-protein] synthase-3
MNGRMVFKHAITRMVEVSHQVLSETGKTVAEVDLLLPHQANMRINQMVASQLGIPEEKVVNTISWTGNTTAATIPICMHEALKQEKLKENDLVLLTAFGAGFTWAATLLHW